MVEAVNEESCDGCGVCVENCPVFILRVTNGKVGITNPAMCTDCRICMEVCPKQVLGVK
jgi:NAD-dependent dihydropyrimidine dehydrogenase PreA subunit